MHLHAAGVNDQGPAPIAICTPYPSFPAWDQRQPYVQVFLGPLKEPTCPSPVWSPETDEGLRDETIEVVRRHNVFGVLSGPTWRVQEWQAAAPGRFIAGLGFRIGPSTPSPDSLRALFEAGALEVLAEVTTQYQGIAPDDERLEPYWALAEELDMPVGVHTGPGPPGGVYLGQTEYRAALSSALLFEDVLVRHPRLRLYVMHAGYPLLDDMLALLYAYPQVYVEVGVIVFSRPRVDFYRYLRGLMDAGFGDRIMFGSDQMSWPGTIERSIAVIEEAPFLSPEEKRGILYENAARFLRLGPEERARHLAASREDAPGGGG
jgi:predicted TIM-barrel fold metal-dependent hydrolase